MECWSEQNIGGIGMSSFDERQASLVTQVLRGYSCVSRDLPLIEQHQKQQNLLHHCHGGVSNLGFYGYGGGVCDVGDGGWQYDNVVSGDDGGGCYEAEPYDERLTGGDLPIPAALPVLDEMSFVPLWRSQPKLEDSSACNQPPCKRPKTTAVACYTLEDILKKLPRGGDGVADTPQFLSDMTLASSPLGFCRGVETYDEKLAHRSYRKPVAVSSGDPQSVAARHRRTKIREKIRSLEKLIPPGSKPDTAKMLEESYKYVKFLQAQVKLLESLPSSSYAIEEVEPVLNSNNGNVKKRVDNVNSFAPRSNPSFWNVSGAVSVQRPSSPLKKLSTQQMLHVLVTSSTIQRKLFTAENCVATLQQKKMLMNSKAFVF